MKLSTKLGFAAGLLLNGAAVAAAAGCNADKYVLAPLLLPAVVMSHLSIRTAGYTHFHQHI